MTTVTVEKTQAVTILLNGTINSIKAVIPISFQTEKPQLLERALEIQFGVLIGFVGDIKGKFVLKAEPTIFSAIGEVMFGMQVEGEMLTSFAGELGNMIAGGISTYIADNGIKTDITSPTVMDGNTVLSGFEKALKITISFQGIGEMDIYLLLDR